MKSRSFQFCFGSNEKGESSWRWPSEKVTVVSLIGKSTDINGGGKGGAFRNLLSTSVFGGQWDSDGPEQQTRVEGFYCSAERVVYLHLRCPLDTAVLGRLCREMRTAIDESGFLTCWSELRYAAARALLFLFSVSHLIVLQHPSHVFDLSYIQMFVTIDACRQKLLRPVTETLRSVPGLPSGWVNHGRPCPPRLLFYFASCPPAVARHKTRAGRDPCEQLQHSLEDQIYRLLRKVRVITNASAQSLFALPGNQPFVYVESAAAPGRADPLLVQVRLLQQLCLQPDDRSVPPPTAGHGLWTSAHAPNSAAASSFAALVGRHLITARTKGFDDNVGKHLAAPNFDLPPADLWRKAAVKLFNEIISAPDGSAFKKPLSGLRSALDSDARFSEARCAKVLPIAVAAYQEGLPARYSLEYHTSKLEHAQAVFRSHARGPSCALYRGQLQAECDALWRQGRQICETLSLTGNPCINPVHRLPGETEDSEDEERRRPETEHCSGVRYLATCNCGRKQRQRDDPFQVRRANYDFYVSVSEGCCRGLQQHQFPVFQPGATAGRAAAVVSAVGGRSGSAEAPAADAEEGSISPTFGLGLSQGEADQVDRGAAEGSSPSDISLTVKKEARKEPEVLASTEEYLDGMLTTTTPRHLLPEYPSFSLVCVGQSSLYSHAVGLNGFIQGSNYLLPWELRMKTEKHDTGKRYIKKKDTYDIYAKIFIGMEYECPRGHRFMLSAPDRVMKALGTSLVKDSAATVANSDMPLYFNCPCSKKTKPFVGQLMRVHVVTPKSSVRVTLEPRVQPEPTDGSVFVPGGCAVELSPAAYWVLRLPYLYQDGHGLVVPPRTEVLPAGRGLLLRDMFGVVIRDEIM